MQDRTKPATDVETCEVCVIGAGIGGLNALFAASRHLTRKDRVILVDQRARVGGMWTSVYPYVRLHQPHPMFTAGNIAWQGSKPRHHLADREEVLAHLQHCYDELSKRVDLQLCAGYDYQGHDEDDARNVVSVRCSSVAEGGKPLLIEAKRLIDARGFGIATKHPLSLSSQHVQSLSPDFMSSDASELNPADAPIYVVGGGKTAMDTAYRITQLFPGRELTLLIGAGTMFQDRDKLYPTGARRYFGGTVGSNLFLELAELFDGNNEDAVTDRLGQQCGLALDPRCRRHMYGLLSRSENEAILNGAKEVTLDYLVDVVDREGQPRMVLRSGKEQSVPPGSIFINATGYFNETAHEYQPFASRSERVLAINPRSSITFFPAYTGYLLVEAAYRGSLLRLPLYELDTLQALKHAKGAFLATSAAHTFHNAVQFLDGMPMAAQKAFGANFTLWFPLPRQVNAGLRILSFHKKHPNHFQKSLDRVRERFGIRLGPLVHDVAPAAAQ